MVYISPLKIMYLCVFFNRFHELNIEKDEIYIYTLIENHNVEKVLRLFTDLSTMEDE